MNFSFSVYFVNIKPFLEEMLKFPVARFKALQSRSDFIAYLIAFKKYLYRDMQFSYTRKPPQLLKALQLL